MVESVANAAISTMLRAQNVGASTSANIIALKSNQKATQAVISQLQEGLDQSKGRNQQLAAAPAQGSSLPRGSLVDMLV